MKIDDGPLNRYLIKNLKPLTEADPSLLANYVAALLKNNKPKKDLQKLCIDQLYDFLGDGTKSFVVKLFHALEDGTVPSSAEEMENSKQVEAGSVLNTDVAELRTSPPQLERLPSTAIRTFSDEGEEESSDDEDDDRNHKHRRRVSRSRSFDRDGEDEVDRGLYRKRGRATDNGQTLRENERQGNERRGPVHSMHADRDFNPKFERRMGREHGSGRFNGEGGQRGGLRAGPQFRGELSAHRFDNPNGGPNGIIRGGMARGRGLGNVWAPHDQRFALQPFPDGPEFGPPLLPPGLPAAAFFPGRGMPGRGAPHNPWPGFGPLSGMGNIPIEHAHSISTNLQVGRGSAMAAGIGIGMNLGMGRPRCLDFEERGYCLMGDLCPMEHGANRIVVEDVQSLSKFNLPVLPTGRGMGMGPASGPSSGPMLPPGLALVNRANRGSREASLPAVGEEASLLNGAVAGSAVSEPDSYDPDQPLWNKDRPETSAGIRKLPSFSKGSQDQEWDVDLADKGENREGEGVETDRLLRAGVNNNGAQVVETGASVWDRIGPVDRSVSRVEGGQRPASGTVEAALPVGKQVRKESTEDLQTHGRGSWQGKWHREVELEEDSAAGVPAHLPQARGRGLGRSDVGAGQKSAEGTSYGSRATGGRGNAGFGNERAQRTLYVSFIPANSNRTELLLSHFQKFGDILDIRIPPHSDRAFVQFSRREDAESALTAPDAVMGNRFIRLSWANRDSISGTGDSSASTSVGRIPKTLTLPTKPSVQNVKGSEKVGMNGSGTVTVDLPSTDCGAKPASANGASAPIAPVGSTQKKQEELEHMRDEIRKKQMALAQKRDDFRRKLDKLAKQGSTGRGDASEAEQPAKRVKVDDAEEQVTGSNKQISPTASSQLPSTGNVSSEQMVSSPVLVKTGSAEIPKQTPSLVVVPPLQPSPRGGRLPHTRLSGNVLVYGSPMPWGTQRFKLDNRTTVFRVLPPFSVAAIDISVVKEHFAMFGELAGVELEDGEGQKVGGSKLSDTTSIRVTFSTRRAAERAFAQGRWLHGQSLQLVWVNSTSASSGSGVAALNRPVEVSQKTSPLGLKAATGITVMVDSKATNENRPTERDNNHVQEIQDLPDSDVSGEGTEISVSKDETRLSSPMQSLDLRRDSLSHVQVSIMTGGGSSGHSGSPTESAVETAV